MNQSYIGTNIVKFNLSQVSELLQILLNCNQLLRFKKIKEIFAIINTQFHTLTNMIICNVGTI